MYFYNTYITELYYYICNSTTPNYCSIPLDMYFYDTYITELYYYIYVSLQHQYPRLEFFKSAQSHSLKNRYFKS